jgi:addiction module HigA family antidote
MSTKSLRNPRRRPTHPGAILREDVLPALSMTQVEFARRLGVSRLTVSEILHEKRGVSPEMAARIGKFLNTTPESWLRMQEAVDLWDIQQHPERFSGITPLEPDLLAA